MANCVQIPDFIVPECDFESGRVVAIAIISKRIFDAIYADPTNASLWVDGSYAADLHIFQEVNGTIADPSAIDVPGIGNQDTRTINADRTAEIMIQGVKSNESFFNELVKSHEHRFAFVTGGSYQTLFMVNKDCNFFGGFSVESGLDTSVDWKMSVKWKDINSPQSSDVPTGVFN